LAQKRRKHAKEFKVEAVRLVLEQGRTIAVRGEAAEPVHVQVSEEHERPYQQPEEAVLPV
jgi:transposase-like protein